MAMAQCGGTRGPHADDRHVTGLVTYQWTVIFAPCWFDMFATDLSDVKFDFAIRVYSISWTQ